MKPTDNIYLPKTAILDQVIDEIAEVKTFYWHFEDEAEQKAFKRFRPGQFAQVSLFGVGEFPASLPPSPTEDETFFTIRAVGSCTAAFHQLKPGDKFGVRGPYGNGFHMEEYYGKNLVFVAGGIGLIPLRSCIVYALKHRDKYKHVRIYYGSKTPKDLLYTTNLREWETAAGIECRLTVDRPCETEVWTGNIGVVGSLFKQPGGQVPVENTVAFVCGPPIMFRFVIKDLLALGFQGHNIVSTLERYMKCGVGKCGHCCIGVAYVCTDGPVFTYEQIKKLGENI
jgi:NAD(P)H-flavin reductase